MMIKRFGILLNPMIWVFAIAITMATTMTLMNAFADQEPSVNDADFFPPLPPGQLAPFTLAALKAELLADPAGIGFGCSGVSPVICTLSDNQIAAAMNNPGGVGGGTIDVAFLLPQDMQSEVVASEYLLLTEGQRDLWLALSNLETVPIRDPEIRGQLMAVWVALTTTRANLALLQTRLGSRAEVLWGDGTAVSAFQVQTARTDPSIP